MQDEIIKVLAQEGKVSFICASTTQLVEKARNIHDLSPLATATLGRTLTMTAMMGTQMKNAQDRLTVQIKGNGPIGTIVCVGNSKGIVKGYVANPLVELPLKENGKLDVGRAVGNQGYLNIIKDIGLKQPYIGMVALTSGEIAEDFTHYFATSEQKPSAVALGVLINQDGVKSSGGYILTLMPDATEELAKQIEEQLANIQPISQMLDQGIPLIEIAKMVTNDTDVKIVEEGIQPNYMCDCSKEKIQNSLISLGAKELEDMIEKEQKIEVTCHFCNQQYHFSKEVLQELKNRIQH